MNLILLKKLLEAASPSGHEHRAVQVFIDEAKTFADHVYTDFYGNAYAVINPDAGEPFLLEAHIDEIGLIVRYVDEQGYLYIGSIGGADPRVYIGQRVRLICPDGDLLAVVGSKPIHLMTSEESNRPTKLSDLYLDTGLDAQEVKAKVPIGTAAVIEQPPLFVGSKVFSRALDNRIGVFCILETLRELKKTCSKQVVALASVQEEVGHHGAKIGAHRIQAKAAISIDVTFETSQPQVDIHQLGPSPFGSGANLCVVPILHQGIRRELEQTARDHNIPYTLSTSSSIAKSHTNADDITLTASGIPTALVSVPCRYMHSPSEMVDLEDAQACIRLMTQYLQTH